jgi:hypothetical protein
MGSAWMNGPPPVQGGLYLTCAFMARSVVLFVHPPSFSPRATGPTCNPQHPPSTQPTHAEHLRHHLYMNLTNEEAWACATSVRAAVAAGDVKLPDARSTTEEVVQYFLKKLDAEKGAFLDGLLCASACGHHQCWRAGMHTSSLTRASG